jgi:hypothetical protein
MTIKFSQGKRAETNAETGGVGNIKGRKVTSQKGKSVAKSKTRVKKK